MKKRTHLMVIAAGAVFFFCVGWIVDTAGAPGPNPWVDWLVYFPILVAITIGDPHSPSAIGAYAGLVIQYVIFGLLLDAVVVLWRRWKFARNAPRSDSPVISP